MSDILIETPAMCDECGAITGHELWCSQYIKPNMSIYEQLATSESLLAFRSILLDSNNYYNVIALTGVEISKLQLHVKSLYNRIESPTEDDVYYYEELIETLMVLPNYDGYDNDIAIYASSQKEDELILSKDVSINESTGDMFIELSSYVTGVVESKPTDVVLVIDHSGSMYTAADPSKPIYDINQLDTSKVRNGYYVAFPKTGNRGYLLKYVDGKWVSDKYITVVTYTSSGSFYGFNNNIPYDTNRIIFDASISNNYIYAVSITGGLYDALEIFMEEMKNAVDCRVAVVTFAGLIRKGKNSTANEKNYQTDGSLLESGVDYFGSGIFINGELVWDATAPSLTDAQYADAFEDPTTEHGQIALNKIIDAIDTSYGNTPTAIGLLYARRLFIEAGRSNSEKIAIIFTDGVPSPEYIGCRTPESCKHKKEDYYNPVTEKYEASYLNCDYCNLVTVTTPDGATDYAVRTTYIDQAKRLKESQKATVYSIGASSGNAGYDVLKNIATSENHVFGASGEQTKDIFHDIASVIVSTSQNLNSNTFLVDVLTDYFELPDYVNVNGDGINVYTAKCVGQNNQGEYIFDIPVKFADANIVVDKKNNHVSVSNFDYKENVVTYVGGVSTGKKLIVNIPIIPSNNFVGGDNIATNKSTSGIYNVNENGEYTSLKTFDIPYFEPSSNDTGDINGGSYYGFLKLSQDTIVNGIISVENGKTLVLDLNGFVLQSEYGNRIIDVKSGGKLIIVDSNLNSSHLGSMSGGIWIYNDDNADVEVKGGIITGCVLLDADGAIYNCGETIINGGTIIGNKCGENGAAVYVNDGTIIMQNGNIKYNQTSEKEPINVLLNNGSFQYYDGQIGIPYDTGLRVVNGVFKDNKNDSSVPLKHELYYYSTLNDTTHNNKIPESRWITSPRGGILHKEDSDPSSPTWADLFPEYEFVGWESHDDDSEKIVNLYAIWEKHS